MKIKRTLVSVIAALGLAASVMTPVAMAQTDDDVDTNNETDALVTVADNGEFDVFFGGTEFNLSNVTLNSANPSGTATGTFTIKYKDTKAYRPPFNVFVNASDFSNQTSTTGPSIPATGFTIEHTGTVVQALCGGPGAVECPTDVPDYGDIGFRVNEQSVSQSASDGVWTTSNTLNQARNVQFGYGGVGTTSSYGPVDVALDVPVGTISGDYKSDLILTVTFTGP